MLCVWSSTLIVSNGWPTSVTAIPPHVPARMSLMFLFNADPADAPDSTGEGTIKGSQGGELEDGVEGARIRPRMKSKTCGGILTVKVDYKI
mmetsp:Transcript_39734/g.55170  ORF Transcript_39734/g.55170 Transcript_39734/m.55170 type:complete len:91 (-) Transcript_39734:89-361(-)